MPESSALIQPSRLAARLATMWRRAFQCSATEAGRLPSAVAMFVFSASMFAVWISSVEARETKK